MSRFGKRLAYRSLQSVVERRCHYAGLTEVVMGRIKSRYSIHDLRHTFAILWLGEHDYLAPAEGYKKLGQLMGRSNIQTAQKYKLYDVRGGGMNQRCPECGDRVSQLEII